MLTVSYAGLTLPEGIVEARLRLAVWTGDSWMTLSGSFANPTDKLVRAPINLDYGPGVFAVFDPRGMGVSIEEGPSGSFAGDSLRVGVQVESDIQVESVIARMNDRAITLGRASQDSDWQWTGWIPLDGLPRGQYVVRATATRVDGLALTDTMVFLKDYPPVVTVSEPLAGATIGQTFRARATCADDDPAGCKSLEVWVHRAWGEAAVLLTTGTGSIDRELSLGGRVGTVVLTFIGTDQVGQRTWNAVTVNGQ